MEINLETWIVFYFLCRQIKPRVHVYLKCELLYDLACCSHIGVPLSLCHTHLLARDK